MAEIQHVSDQYHSTDSQDKNPGLTATETEVEQEELLGKRAIPAQDTGLGLKEELQHPEKKLSI